MKEQTLFHPLERACYPGAQGWGTAENSVIPSILSVRVLLTPTSCVASAFSVPASPCWQLLDGGVQFSLGVFTEDLLVLRGRPGSGTQACHREDPLLLPTPIPGDTSLWQPASNS